ncbi:OTU domain-containing protein 6B [Blyttiomyces sp. JEL0837]|nr:OTU domain-containing protein 6B [Blyttiomyces sp. JEL0837]
MEADQKKRHEDELKALREALASVTTEVDSVTQSGQQEEEEKDESPSSQNALSTPAQKKPNRQQQRKARKNAAMEEQRKQAELEAANTVNMKEVEENALSEALQGMSLRIRQVAANGHCLYNAISDQLQLRDGETQTYLEIRKRAADYMRRHPDDFLPFLVNDAGDLMTSDEYTKYCDDVEKTATWGGQLEIQALSMSLKREIHVVQMGTPPIKIGEPFKSAKPLTLS